MITKEQAQNCYYRQILHYTGRQNCNVIYGSQGGKKEKIIRVRVSGKCQVWKTRPNDFKLPVKYGLRESSYVTNENCADFHFEKDCPLLNSDAD